MFTGIIQSLGKVVELVPQDGSLEIQLSTQFNDLELGESVAVNGVCLTVTQANSKGDARFFLSPETLSRSNLGQLTSQSVLNLERALSLQTRLSGHWVQGHVDGLAKLISIEPSSESYSLKLLIPAELARYCVEKGSICLDGISLTVNTVLDQPNGPSTIGVTIIPHTWTHTHLSHRKVGDLINVEVDILAKYVERLCRR